MERLTKTPKMNLLNFNFNYKQNFHPKKHSTRLSSLIDEIENVPIQLMLFIQKQQWSIYGIS